MFSRGALVVLGLAAVVGCVGCKTPAPSTGFVVVVDGRVVHRGAAAYTVRAAAREPESVVAVDGVGEVLVVGDGCRFVRADAGLSSLQILEHAGPCAVVRDDRLCFSRARFGDSVVVDGCADRNTIFRDRTAATEGGATLAPKTLLEYCVPLPDDDPRYVRVDDVRVDDRDARKGARFRWNGDGFDVCFLAPHAGAQWQVRALVNDKVHALAGTVDVDAR
jgi:hypothetical protein